MFSPSFPHFFSSFRCIPGQRTESIPDFPHLKPQSMEAATSDTLDTIKMTDLTNLMWALLLKL